MKEDIKEILDNFKDYEKRYKQFNETQFIIFYRDIHLLLDYITNLQEELKSANESITWYSNRFKAVERDNRKLKNEIKELERMCELYGKSLYNAELTDYKSRNEKAREYVEHHKFNKFGDIDCGEAEEIINILNGGDEE